MDIDVNEKGYTFDLTLVLVSWNAGNFMFYLQLKVFNNLNNKEKIPLLSMMFSKLCFLVW